MVSAQQSFTSVWALIQLRLLFMSTSAVTLKPTAGFCVKSTTLQDALYKITPTLTSRTPVNSSSLLEPSGSSNTNVGAGMVIPKGLKVFVNIAWDAGVPPPPEGSEDVIQRAMLGEELDELRGWW